MGNALGCVRASNAFFCAVRDGDTVLVEHLLSANPRLARHSTFGIRNSALHYACAKGYEEIVLLLLTNGAEVNVRNYCGQTPLMHACRFGHWSVVLELVLRGANVHMEDVVNGRTALHYAAAYGHASCIRILVGDFIPSAPLRRCITQSGCTFYSVDPGHATNASSSCSNKGQSLASLINSRSDSGLTPLHLAAMHAQLETVTLLLDLGASANSLSGSELTLQSWDIVGSNSSALHYAASSGSVLCCQILLSRGAEPTLRNGNGWMPLHVARIWKHACLLEILDPNTPAPMLRFGPSRYLSLPLHSVLTIARATLTAASRLSSPPKPKKWHMLQQKQQQKEKAQEGEEIADAKISDVDVPSLSASPSSPPPLSLPSPPSLPASSSLGDPHGEDCAVCLERPCAVAAPDCMHELCARCALHLCANGNLGQHRHSGHDVHQGDTLVGTIPCPFCRKPIMAFVEALPKKTKEVGVHATVGAAVGAAAGATVLS